MGTSQKDLALDKGMKCTIPRDEQPPSFGGPSHSLDTSTTEEVVSGAESAGAAERSSLTGSLAEAIPMSTLFKVRGARAEALEWVADSLRGFFFEVSPCSLTYFSILCLFFFFLALLAYAVVGCRKQTCWLTSL